MGRDGCFPATPGSGRASPKVLQTHLRDAGELLQDARRIRHRSISIKNHRGWGMVNHPKIFFSQYRISYISWKGMKRQREVSKMGAPQIIQVIDDHFIPFWYILVLRQPC